MAVTHPLALRDASPGGYTYGSLTHSIDDDGVIDCPESLEVEIAETLAERYGVGVDDLLAGDVEPGDTVCTCDVGDACHECGGKCPTVKTDGEVCGGERPCQYHDNQEG